jgi:hypothetical protein
VAFWDSLADNFHHLKMSRKKLKVILTQIIGFFEAFSLSGPELHELNVKKKSSRIATTNRNGDTKLFSEHATREFRQFWARCEVTALRVKTVFGVRQLFLWIILKFCDESDENCDSVWSLMVLMWFMVVMIEISRDWLVMMNQAQAKLNHDKKCCGQTEPRLILDN